MTAIEPTPTAAPRRRPRRPSPPTGIRVVDTDVHHGLRDKSDLYPYLSKVYAERLAEYGGVSAVIGTGHGLYNGGAFGRRVDLVDPQDPGDRGTAAMNRDTLRRNLLDEGGVDVAILTGAQLYGASNMTDQDYAGALCRAFNDYTLEHWVGADPRFRSALMVCAQDPAGAAAEIDRLGDHPAVVGIVMPCGAIRPYGHRFYHPIYAACARHGLAVGLHFGGEGSGINPAPTAAGFPSYYIEARQARPAFYQAHLSSFVFEGVFEKFPTLRVVMLESGFAWVAPYVWRMDTDWKGLRHQTPWVKRLPSEYVWEHVRFCCQPVDEPATDTPHEDTRRLIDWMHGERTLLFSSDYPHWDWEDPQQTLTFLPAPLRARVVAENARETYRL
jgi:predicted TIM-barrel fold metal-dependent hydrolase